MRILKLLAIFSVSFVFMVIIVNNSAHEINHEKEYIEKDFKDKDLVKVLAVEDGAVDLTISEHVSNSKKNLIRAELRNKDIYKLTGKKNLYIGKVELVEIKDVSAILKVDIKSSPYYYLTYYLISALVSLIITFLIILVLKKTGNKEH